jgi:hypothetical protein
VEEAIEEAAPLLEATAEAEEGAIELEGDPVPQLQRNKACVLLWDPMYLIMEIEVQPTK